LLDLPTEKLSEIKTKIEERIKKHRNQANTTSLGTTRTTLKRNISELFYTRAVVLNIIELRKQRYFLPVQGY
jgi:hypothetical protein